MLKMIVWALSSGLVLGGGLVAAQMHTTPDMSGMTSPQEMMEMQASMQKAQSEMVKEISPELYAFQERLRKIEMQIGKILERLAKEEIDRETARAELLPLVREAKEIENDPDFIVEQRLAQAAYASPRYQKMMEETMLKFKSRRKPAPRR